MAWIKVFRKKVNDNISVEGDGKILGSVDVVFGSEGIRIALRRSDARALIDALDEWLSGPEKGEA